jgi:hypothetical protein
MSISLYLINDRLHIYWVKSEVHAIITGMSIADLALICGTGLKWLMGKDTCVLLKTECI